MITININILDCNYPIMLSQDDLYNCLITKYKGSLLSMIEKALIEFQSDDNDLVEMRLKKIVENYTDPILEHLLEYCESSGVSKADIIQEINEIYET